MTLDRRPSVWRPTREWADRSRWAIAAMILLLAVGPVLGTIGGGGSG